MAYVLRMGLRVRVPRDVVFQHLLLPQHLARWWCNFAQLEPKPGGKFAFGGDYAIARPEGHAFACRFTGGVVRKSVTFAWPLFGAETTVTWDVEDDADGSVLRVIHERLPTLWSTCGSLHDAWRMCLGNLKAIAEGRSDGVRPDHSPIELPEVRLATIVDAPRERVFAALTDPSQIDHWVTGGLPGGNVRLEPRPGGKLSLGWERGPDRVLEIERDRRLVLGWPSEWGDLRIAFDLETKASGTAVYLTSRGYGPGRTHDVLLDRGGWSDHLTSLRNLVESGEAGFLNPYADQVRDA